MNIFLFCHFVPVIVIGLVASRSIYQEHCFVKVYLDLSKMAPKRRKLSGDLKETIVKLHKSGLGYKKIIERIHISFNTVAKMLQKFKNTGVVRPNSRSGRPSLLTKRDARYILQCVTNDRRRSASSFAQEVFSVSGKTVSAQTVRRSLINNGLHRRVPRTNLKRLGRRAKFQHDNDPKYTSKMTSNFLSDDKVNVLPRLTVSPDLNPIKQWFFTLLEVLNSTSSIHAFIEPFVVGAFFPLNSKHMYITIYCISALESGVNQTAEPLKLTHRTPGVRSNAGYEPLL